MSLERLAAAALRSISMRSRYILVAALVASLALAPVAEAKLRLQFDRATARPGERVSLRFGDYFSRDSDAVHVYLVHAPILGDVIRPAQGGGVRRLGPPPRRSGVVKVGQTTSGQPGLRFKVPKLRAGRYAAVIWCSTCRYPYLLASAQGGIPDDAYVRADGTLLRVRAT